MMSISYEKYKLDGIMEMNGLPSFDEVSVMESEIEFCDNEKVGNYRLSANVLCKLAADKTLTSSALVLFLYFLQICDANNYVSDFNYREITNLKRADGTPVLSVKSFYNALKLLKESKYISYSADAYKTRSIRILGNNIGPKDTFLNLNYDALVFGTPENDQFLNIPVKAKLLYLEMLSRSYSIRKHGSRINLTRLKNELKITTERAFEYYLYKVENLIGKIPRVKNSYTNKKRQTVTIPMNLRHKFAPKEGMLEGQANYFARMFERLLSSYAESSVDYYSDIHKGYIKTQFFVVLKDFISYGPAKVFKVFEYVISEAAGLTFGALNDAIIILSNASAVA